jgi:hypothetical protein
LQRLRAERWREDDDAQVERVPSKPEPPVRNYRHHGVQLDEEREPNQPVEDRPESGPGLPDIGALQHHGRDDEQRHEQHRPLKALGDAR